MLSRTNNREIYLALILCSCFIFTSCSSDNPNTQETRISDVRKSEYLILKKKSSQGNIHSLYITITGHINGNATVSRKLDKERYDSEKINGKVNVSWGGDWYSDTVEIQYDASDVKSGDLIIGYAFNDI